MIRRATSEDIAGVHACLVAAFAPYETQYTPAGYRDSVPDHPGLVKRAAEMTVLVALDPRGDVVGTVVYEAKGDVGHLRGMAVLPEHEGRGYAAALLAQAEEDLARAGCQRVTLDTTAPLTRAIAFYTRHGYRPTGVVSDFFGMPLFEYARTISAIIRRP